MNCFIDFDKLVSFFVTHTMNSSKEEGTQQVSFNSNYKHHFHSLWNINNDTDV
jgi:hypothetical protein